MGRIRGFILAEFGKYYALIFLPFFSILSIVYLIRISILSQKIILDPGEFLELFGFFLPSIIFYTLHLSFIAALTVTLKRLSQENELIALFSFGFKPLGILKILLLPTLLFVLLMLIISLYMIPKSTLAYKRFEQRKSAEAELTITPNRLGQKFGKYIVFLGAKQEHLYRDVVLFTSNKRQKRVLLIAQSGVMEHNHSNFSLHLYNGTGDTFLPERIESITYQQMQIYNTAGKRPHPLWMEHGWSRIRCNKKEMALFVYDLFLSLSPLLILGMAAALSIIHPRYEKSSVYLVSFGIAVLLYASATFLKKSGTPLSFLLISSLFILSSILLFRKRTQANF